MTSLPASTVGELILFAHPAEHHREAGELRLTTAQVAWRASSGSSSVNIPWPQISKDQYSKYNPSKAVDIVSMCLHTVTKAKPLVFTLLGSSEASRRELERVKVIVRDALKGSSKSRGSARLAWLEADKALFKEYTELVRDSKVIDEEDFWREKESSLSVFDSGRMASEKGSLTALCADETEVDESGKIKVKVTPEIIHNTFRLYPAVAKAYKDHVPEHLSEKEFWTKYFRSEYYAKDKGGGSTSGKGNYMRTDDMFQRYDDEITASTSSSRVDRLKERSRHVADEVNLISTYNDYHHSEQLESFDVPTDASKNPVVQRYIRNTNLIVDSIVKTSSNSELLPSNMTTDDDNTRFPEQMRENPPDFIEMPHLNARLDSAVELEDEVEVPSTKKSRRNDIISSASVVQGISSIFGDLGSNEKFNESYIHRQDQELYIKILQFPDGFRKVISLLV